MLDRVIDGSLLAATDTASPVTVPVFVLASDPALSAFPPSTRRGWRASHPGVEVVRLAGAGHSIHDERAHRDEYARHLARVPQESRSSAVAAAAAAATTRNGARARTRERRRRETRGTRVDAARERLSGDQCGQQRDRHVGGRRSLRLRLGGEILPLATAEPMSLHVDRGRRAPVLFLPA